MGVYAKDKAYAQTAAYTTATATLTQYSNVILAISTANININDRVSSTNTAIQANLNSGTIVTQIINSSAVAISSPYMGTTLTTSANVTFQHNFITGYNIYDNTTPNVFQNGQSVGVFNVVNVPNTSVITANITAGSAVLTNVYFTVSTTGTLTQGSTQVAVTSNTGITPGLVVTANTPGVPANSVVASVSGTTVTMTGTFSNVTVTGANLAFTQANVGVVYGNTTASLGANIQNSSNTVVLASNVTGSGAVAGIVQVSAYNSGPPPQAYQNLTSQASTWLVGGASFTGNYSVACNQITSLASAPSGLAAGQIITSGVAGIPLNTTIASVNSTVITMSALATAAATGATVNSYYNVPITYVQGANLYLSNASLTAAAGNTYTTTSLVGINPSMQVYTAATGSFTNAGLSVANVVGTNVILTQTASAANSNSALIFSNISIGTVATGNALPTISSNTQVANVNGYMVSSGNAFVITSINSGPPPVVGQLITGSGVTSCYIVSACTSPVGTYVVSVAQAVASSGSPQVFTTVIPSVAYVNTSAILLNANAIGTTTGNLVSVSSYEKSAYGRGVSAGWMVAKYGTGPVVPANSTVNAAINSTATSGYSNGETIVVSGGSANALLTITTNTQSGVAGANIASVAITYPGYGFTNTSTLTYTYQHQLHVNAVFIANASVAVTGYSNTDFFRITSSYNLANVTGYIAGSNLYVSANQTGTLAVGDVITATTTGLTGTLTNNSPVITVMSGTTGVVVGQIVTSTTSGIPAGTTVTAVNSGASTVTLSAPYTGTTQTLAALTFAIAANTQVLAQLTSNAASAGGTGVYALSNYQYVASNTSTYNNFAVTGQIQVATANIVTATGGSFTNTGATSPVILTPGLFRSGFTNTNLTVVLYKADGVTAGGSGTGITGQTANFAAVSSGTPVNVTLGGKSGRIMTESLVPISGKNENAADNTLFPNS